MNAPHLAQELDHQTLACFGLVGRQDVAGFRYQAKLCAGDAGSHGFLAQAWMRASGWLTGP